MGLAGFGRNCLADWLRQASAATDRPLDADEARTAIYGMAYSVWKTAHQQDATPEQLARMHESRAKNRLEHDLDDALDDSFPASDPPSMTQPGGCSARLRESGGRSIGSASCRERVCQYV